MQPPEFCTKSAQIERLEHFLQTQSHFRGVRVRFG
jgi:hypothetical protein